MGEILMLQFPKQCGGQNSGSTWAEKWVVALLFSVKIRSGWKVENCTELVYKNRTLNENAKTLRKMPLIPQTIWLLHDYDYNSKKTLFGFWIWQTIPALQDLNLKHCFVARRKNKVDILFVLLEISISSVDIVDHMENVMQFLLFSFKKIIFQCYYRSAGFCSGNLKMLHQSGKEGYDVTHNLITFSWDT